MKKRNFLKGAAGAIAALSASKAVAAEVDSCGRVANSATFVLVHGAWGGGFNYEPVSGILRAKGHRVFTPTLTGLGERSHLAAPGVDLATHITDVVNVIRFNELENVVLAGHSYGGMVITGVADVMPERIASMVYLDAFLPEDGQSIADIAPLQHLIEQMRAARARGEHLFPFPNEFVRNFGIPEEVLWRFTPHPVSTQLDPIRLTGRQETVPKKTFVKAEKWDDHAETFERLKNDPAWRTVTIPTGHIMMAEMPERTAEILEEAI